ncbi:MAG TPA: polyprenyl synthetase family protein [Microlunatus sp.]|nr:polyprenyl synthetase family protein [Microlunatus sp.]
MVGASHLISPPAVVAGGLTLNPERPLSSAVRGAVDGAISGFLDSQAPVLAAMGPELDRVLDLLHQTLAGGKRLRPAFCLWSYLAADGDLEHLPAVVGAASSFELLHVSALVHDDVMDGSDLRRGQPAAHRQFEALHRSSGWVGDSAGFGRSGAILVGDLLVMWSVQLAQHAGLPADALERTLPVIEAMRTEVTCGQYLDVVAQVQPLRLDNGSGIGRALDEASRVVEYKSARYTVLRPCQAGAAMAGASPELHDALAAYGSPLGRAFQFRDDLLGVFGDPDVTGKPAGDDLREGKRTVLVAHALAGADARGRRLLARGLGDPALDDDGVAELQDVITASGAREDVESMIAAGHRQALRALADADLTPAGRTALTALADLAVRRDA